MTSQLKQTEKAFERAVVEYAELNGWLVYHTQDSRRSNSGFPDLTLVRGDRLVFAELKADRGRLSDAQVDWVHALDLVEHVQAGVFRPSMWSEIEKVLAR